MRVLAQFPELDAPTGCEPPVAQAAVVPAPVQPPVRRGRSADAPRFPLASIVALSVMAAACWAGVWWHERATPTGVEQRPERLAREVATEAAGRETITP